jgi:hypothetical protein
MHGLPMTDNAIYDRIVARTREGLGQPINPHLFRDCAATSVAIDDPAHIGIASRLLGSRFTFAERSWNNDAAIRTVGERRMSALMIAETGWLGN